MLAIEAILGIEEPIVSGDHQSIDTDN